MAGFLPPVSWFQRVFEGLQSHPREMSGIVVPIVDNLGAGRLGELSVNAASQVGDGIAAVNLATTSVPANRVWWVHSTNLRQDGAASIGTKLYMVVPSAEAGLESLFLLDHERNRGNNDSREHGLFARGFYLPPRSFLRGLSVAALGAADVATLDALYVEIPIGEYVKA